MRHLIGLLLLIVALNCLYKSSILSTACMGIRSSLAVPQCWRSGEYIALTDSISSAIRATSFLRIRYGIHSFRMAHVSSFGVDSLTLACLFSSTGGCHVGVIPIHDETVSSGSGVDMVNARHSLNNGVRPRFCICLWHPT